MVMQGSPKTIGARVKSEVWESLGDWIQLIKSLGAWPTSVHKLVATSMRSVVPAHSDLDSISDVEYGSSSCNKWPSSVRCLISITKGSPFL